MKYMKILTVILLILVSQTCYAAENYEWSSVPYGGGGYITGLVIHPSQPDLIYARTDVGGAYRWSDGEWISLTGDLTVENFFGIAGIAVDPQNPNIVYMAAGKNWWSECDVLKSYDRGATWERCNLGRGQSFYGNGSRREYGECIAVSPNNSDIVYVGTYHDENCQDSGGLWKSADGGQTWSQVSGVPKSDVRSLVFDGDILYASSEGNGVYRIENEQCEKIEGSPASARRMAVSGDSLLIAADNLYRYQGGVITEQAFANNVSYVSAVAAVGDFVVVSADTGNFMKMPIFYSQDGGKTWKDSFQWEEHTSDVPWFRHEYFSSATSCVALDSSDPKKVMFGDWFSVWRTDDITAMRSKWKNPMKGIEEGVPFTAVSAPSGARLIVAMADTDGARYEDFENYPQNTHSAPRLQSATSVNYCESNPDYVARVGVTPTDEYGDGGYSTDNGITWTPFADFPLGSNGHKVQPSRIVVSSEADENGIPLALLMVAVDGTAYRSTDSGASWTKLENFPANHTSQSFWLWEVRVIADKTNGKRFYVANDSADYAGLYKSDDLGLNWEKISDQVFARIKSDFGRPDAIWAVGKADGGLYRSTDGGIAFEKIAGVSEVKGFDLGKPRIGSKESAVYFCGKLNGKYGVYKSDDYGISFESISAGAKNLYNSVTFLTADRQKYGAVYIGTNGTGLLRAEPIAAADEELHETFDNISELPPSWETSGTSVIDNHGANGELRLGEWGGSLSGKAIYKGTRWDNPSYKIQFFANNQGGNVGNLLNVYFNYHDSAGQVSAYRLVLPGGDNNGNSDGGAWLEKIVAGKAEPILLAKAETTASHKNAEYLIQYEYGHIKVSRNGETLLEVVDEAPISPGYVGFEAAASVANIDNVHIDTPSALAVDKLIYAEHRRVPQSLADAQGSTLTAELEIARKETNTPYTVYYSFLSGEELVAVGTDTAPRANRFTVALPAELPPECELWYYLWDADMCPIVEKIQGLK